MKLIQYQAYLKTALGIMHGTRAFNGPLLAGLSLTHRCNIRCRHCYYFSTHLVSVQKTTDPAKKFLSNKDNETPSGRDADGSLFNSLIDELAAMGCQRFQLSGSGEPFLHKNILEFMDRIKSAKRYCAVNTNGTRLDYSMIDELIKISVDELRITTLAGSTAVYNETHPGVPPDTFDKIKDGLLYLAQRKQALGVVTPRVRLTCVVFKTNYDQLVNFAEFAASVNADSVFFAPFNVSGFEGLSELVPSNNQFQEIHKQIYDVVSYLGSRKIDSNLAWYRQVYNREIDSKRLYDTIPCYYGWTGVRIESNGEIYPCCRSVSPLGNVRDESFETIWNSSSYQRFRKNAYQINQRKTSVKGCKCSNCAHTISNLKIYKSLHPIKARLRRL